MKIEIVFFSLLLAGSFVIRLVARRGSERGDAVVYVAGGSVCVSFGGLSEFDWVFGLDRWEIEGGVCIVGV